MNRSSSDDQVREGKHFFFEEVIDLSGAEEDDDYEVSLLSEPDEPGDLGGLSSTVGKSKDEEERAQILEACQVLGDGMENTELHALLQRQMEVAQAVADQEESAWKMLSMMCHLTKVIAEQEQTIMKLQHERLGAERKTAELSVDLRTQYVEISKLKQRYDAAEEQLSAVQDTVDALQQDLKRKNKIIKNQDEEIEELKKKLEKEKEANASKGVAKIRQDRESRLAEIRSFLGSSNPKAPLPFAAPKYRPAENSKLQALRAARDSRLHEIRGLLQKGRSYCTTDSHDSTSVTSMSEDSSMSDLSSVASESGHSENAERNRLLTALQRTRQSMTS